VPFPYYQKLDAKQKALYRRSASIVGIEIERPETVYPRVEALRAALVTGELSTVESASAAVLDALTDKLSVQPVAVEILAVRPKSATSELHGQYQPCDDDPFIQVWMRTAERQQVVAFKTFLRTLVHELCHHLDYVLLELPDSLHTEGFFQRESSLMAQLLPERPGLA